MTSPGSSSKARRLLILNCAEERLQLCLGRPGADGAGAVAEAFQEWLAPARAVSVITPAVQQMLEILGLTLGSLDGVAVTRGPGSFTGLRIAGAIAAGIAAGAGLPLAGIDSLALVARSTATRLAVAGAAEGSLAVLAYSRQHMVFTQAFALPDGAPAGPLAVRDVADLPTWLASLPGPRRACGSGLRRIKGLAGAVAPHALVLPEACDIPTAEALLAAAHEAEYGPEPVELVYLRPSDAEENLERIASGRGIDPAEAARTLAASLARDA